MPTMGEVLPRTYLEMEKLVISEREAMAQRGEKMNDNLSLNAIYLSLALSLSLSLWFCLSLCTLVSRSLALSLSLRPLNFTFFLGEPPVISYRELLKLGKASNIVDEETILRAVNL